MAQKIVIEFVCDRCFAHVPETDFTGTGSILTIAEVKDKRKKRSLDLCADCTSQLTDSFLVPVRDPSIQA